MPVTKLSAVGDPGLDDLRLRRVGVPKQEKSLTDAFLASLPRLARPGPGRSVYVLEEAELGAGRPDIVLLTVSPAALERHIRSGLRLASPVSAKATDPNLSDAELGVTEKHAASVRKELAAQGWFSPRAQSAGRIVSDSLAIEAKVRDWRSGVRQVSKFRRFFNRSALLMPSRPMPEESFRSLNRYQCGLLFQLESNQFDWRLPALPSDATPSAWMNVWLLELLVRGLQRGSAYRLTSDRKASIASE